METLGLVPHPAGLEMGDGHLALGPEASVSGPAPVVRLARRLLGTATGFTWPDGGEAATLALRVDPGTASTPASTSTSTEGYRLAVGPDGIEIVAGAEAGLVNALHTLVQLLPPDILRPAVVPARRWEVPFVDIVDRPRFAWRGVHLDVARHFMPATWLLRFVEVLALHKLDVLHLHLTDDQGWRFPSERYPRLVEVGSWRRGTQVGREGAIDPTPHGGFYTRAELADLVRFAAERNVTILPEIDLPGHVGAALAAYPELGNGTGPYETKTTWGIHPQVLNLEPETLRFCAEILGEVAEVFPGRFVHVGGDEVPTDEWRASARVRQRREQLGLAGEEQLQHWFTAQAHATLEARGRRLVGWDEILGGGIPPEGSVVMSWRGTAGGVAAARAGLDVVMCPEESLYLDYYQSELPDEPLAGRGPTTLADVCAFDPIPPDLDGPAAKRVLGAQVQLWTEHMEEPAMVEYMAFPRTSAFADLVWVPAGGDPAEREARVVEHLARLDVLGVGYRPPSGPLPWQRGGEGRRRRGPNRGEV